MNAPVSPAQHHKIPPAWRRASASPFISIFTHFPALFVSCLDTFRLQHAGPGFGKVKRQKDDYGHSFDLHERTDGRTGTPHYFPQYSGLLVFISYFLFPCSLATFFCYSPSPTIHVSSFLFLVCPISLARCMVGAVTVHNGCWAATEGTVLDFVVFSFLVYSFFLLGHCYSILFPVYLSLSSLDSISHSLICMCVRIVGRLL